MADLILGGGLAIGTGIAGYAGQQNDIDISQRQRAINDRILQGQASDTLNQGDLDAAGSVQRARQIVGGQRGAFAGSGVDVNAGSAGLLANETGTLGALDAITIKNNASKQAMGINMERQNRNLQGELSDLEKRGKGIKSLVGGASRAYDYLKDYKF